MNNNNFLTGMIIESAISVHRELGAGVYESIYEAALAIELRERGLNFRRQVPINAIYRGEDLGLGFKADFIVEESIIIELKSVEFLTKVHFKQLQSYLKLTKKRLGLLINFNEVLLKDGIHRIINGY